MKQTLQPLFDHYDVQACIYGHDHISQANRPAESHTAYIISGGGSKTISSSPKEPFTFFSSNAPCIGDFKEDIEGISIYKSSPSTRYILVSDQQANQFVVSLKEGINSDANQHQRIAAINTASISSDG